MIMSGPDATRPPRPPVDVVTVLAEQQRQLTVLTAAVAALSDTVTGKLQGRAAREHLRHLATLQDQQLSLPADRRGLTADLPEELPDERDRAHSADPVCHQDPVDAGRDRPQPARRWASRRGGG
jgi:hypothetical protein